MKLKRLRVSVASKADFTKMSDEERATTLQELENAAIQRLMDGIVANGLIKYELVENKEHKMVATATLGVYDIREMAGVPEEQAVAKKYRSKIKS